MLALGAVIPSVLLVLVFTFMPVRARPSVRRGACRAASVASGATHIAATSCRDAP